MRIVKGRKKRGKESEDSEREEEVRREDRGKTIGMKKLS